MRILFIAFRDCANPSAVGGDIYLWELARGLSKLGNHVTFVCSRFTGSKSEEKVDGIEVLRVKGLWSLPFRIGRLYLRRLKNTFDVVIEEAIGGQRFPFFASVYVKEPLIAIWHQKNTRVFREQYPLPLAAVLSLLEYFHARIYRNRVIITPSKDSRQKVATLGFSESKVRVVYDGVGSVFENLTMREERLPLIICLGKLRKYKHADHAILALPQILEETRNNCMLIIAGKISEIDGSYPDELRRLSQNLHVETNVDFRLNISETEKLELLRRASVLVQPSPIEGFSIVVIEANRCGTPVVASDGVPSDVVRDGVNGIVYPYGDVEKLSKGVSTLLTNAKLWRQMSANSLAWSQKFSWTNATVELQNVLADAVSNS